MSKPLLAIDFGGTRIRAAVYKTNLTPLSRAETLSQIDDPVENVIARMIACAESVMPPDGVCAIGIAAPGPLDAATGTILYADNLPGWIDIPLAARLSAALGAPAWLENDANLGAWAEHRVGAARGADPTLYLTVSTGFGGGCVVNGQILTGWQGLAMETGFLMFPQPDGSIRKLESLVSGIALGEAAQRRLSESSTPSSLRTLTTIDGKAVGFAAQTGDALAQDVVREAGFWLGIGVVNLVHLFNPEAVVIGGSVAALGDLLFAPMHRVIAQVGRKPGYFYPGLIRAAQLGDDVCLVGAALHALKMLESG